MDFINQLVAQLRDLFSSMTPGARITAGLLLAVVVVSLALLFQQSSSGPDEYLFGGEPLAMSQITRMEAALASAGLSDYEVESNRIRVPRGNKDAYVAAIASGGALPPNFASLMNEALAQASPLESRQQWLQRTKSARENQLSHIIGLMDWVDYATVMYEIDKGIGLNRKDQAAANVFVMPMAGQALDKSRTRNLQRFVAGWHPSLQPESVNVISGGGDLGSDGDPIFTDPLMEARNEFERDKRSELLRELNYITGVRVEVNAIFDNLYERSIHDVKPGEPQVRSETTVNEETETVAGDLGGRPGLGSQGPGRTGVDDRLAREQRSKTKNNTTKTDNVVTQTAEASYYKGFVPKEVFASIAIPRNYIADVWKQKNPDRAEEIPTDNDLRGVETGVRSSVENLVKNLLPKLSLGENEYKQVAVEIIDPITPPPVEPPSLTTNALSWAGRYWTTLSLLGLSAFSLLMMRSVVAGGKTAAESPTLELDIPDAVHHAHEDDEDDDEEDRPKLKLRKERSLKDDLTEIVREDPDSAAAILRGWIGNAS